MQEKSTEFLQQTYLNPVYAKSFPDPFVLKFRGEYFAYCTNFWHDGKVFGVLRSRDLVNWTEIGGAMQPLANNPPFYWAPEVTYSNGKFYLYYSVGNETLMEIRVAISERPDGGFIDSGKRLTTEDFAIDAHVFIDENGEKYFFYATDFLEHTHIGTGTIVDKMLDFFTLEGNPRPVTRARYDWQIYDPNRREKGGVRWHTVEGAFILKRKGIYYEMFSGGNWQNTTYGVSFATTENIEQNEEWQQFSDGEKVFPILRTIPDLVIGPGHNSVIRGSNNRELFCVYHRWSENGRVLAIDRMDFAGGSRMFIKGATNTPQPLPFAPKVLEFFDNFSDENWKIISGNWKTENNQIVSEIAGTSEVICRQKAESFLLETSLRLIEDRNGKFGICLRDSNLKILQFLIEPQNKRAVIIYLQNNEEITEEFALSADFDFQAFHLLRVETDYFTVKISLNEQVLINHCYVKKVPLQFSFIAENCRAAFSGMALTVGFENLFETDDLEFRGWQNIRGNGDCRVENQQLIIADEKGKTIFSKGILEKDYELTVNFCLSEIFDQDFNFGFCPAFSEKIQNPYISFKMIGEECFLQIETPENSVRFPLPKDVSFKNFHQFKFLKKANKIIISSENNEIATINTSENSSKIAFTIQNAAVAFDMIRVTAL